MYHIKSIKIRFLSISLLWIDCKNPKMALCGVNSGIMNLCLQSKESCFEIF